MANYILNNIAPSFIKNIKKNESPTFNHSSSITMCSLHEQRPMEYYCNSPNCGYRVCAHCCIFGSHKGHDIAIANRNLIIEKQVRLRNLLTGEQFCNKVRLINTTARSITLKKQKMASCLTALRDAFVNVINQWHNTLNQTLIFEANKSKIKLEDFRKRMMFFCDHVMKITHQSVGKGKHVIEKSKTTLDAINYHIDQLQNFITPSLHIDSNSTDLDTAIPASCMVEKKNNPQFKGKNTQSSLSFLQLPTLSYQENENVNDKILNNITQFHRNLVSLMCSFVSKHNDTKNRYKLSSDNLLIGLPKPILVATFEFLPLSNIIVLSCVCKQLAHEPLRFSHLDLRPYRFQISVSLLRYMLWASVQPSYQEKKQEHQMIALLTIHNLDEHFFAHQYSPIYVHCVCFRLLIILMMGHHAEVVC